jgi:organic hydroperoxide reductase OsmC/OhrA
VIQISEGLPLVGFEFEERRGTIGGIQISEGLRLVGFEFEARRGTIDGFRLKLFRRFKINELIDFIDFDRLCQNIFSKCFIAKFTKSSVIMNII